MPRVRQPVPLQDSAMGTLIKNCTIACYRCGIEESLHELHQAVTFIKDNIGSSMPKKLAVEFYNGLLEELSFPGHPRLCPPFCHLRIVVNIITDEKLIGLKCTSKILDSLGPREIRRVRGFTELKLETVPYSLRKLHLEYVTTFIHEYACTNSYLVILGQDCPKLNYVDISSSRKVTDVGLHCLCSCPNLRYLSVAKCTTISREGLNYFLSINSSVRELFAWNYSNDAGFDFYSVPEGDIDDSVHPSIRSFAIVSTFNSDISDCHLNSLVTKFPNLSSVKLYGKLYGDLGILQSLPYLSKIDFTPDSDTNWAQFQLLLRSIGSQINDLIVRCGAVYITQKDVDLLHQLCENLKFLVIECSVASDLAKLAIPPFQRLKDLQCIRTSFASRAYVTLGFGKMSELLNLQINGFAMSTDQIRSIILDHTNFPNLQKIGLPDIWIRPDLEGLKKIAKDNNVDLEFTIGCFSNI